MQRFTLILLIIQILCAILQSTQANEQEPEEKLPPNYKEIVNNLQFDKDLWNDEDDQLLRDKKIKHTISHPYEPVPDNFDSRKNWPKCSLISRVIAQGDCGSCWAHATTATISDRTCIVSNGTIQRTVSVEDLLSCCPDEKCWKNPVDYTDRGRCKGSGPQRATTFYIEEGIVSGGHINTSVGCKPLSIGFYDERLKAWPKCAQKCTNKNYKVSYQKDKLFGKNMGELKAPFNLTTLQIEIMKNGPVVGCIFAAKHFMFHGWNKTTHKDIYKGGGTETSTVCNHAVRIVGWGVEGSDTYWIVGNSWSKKWGDNGFFRVLRGQNVICIETKALAPYVGDLPELPSPSSPSSSSPSPSPSPSSSARSFHTLSTSTILTIFCFIILRALS